MNNKEAWQLALAQAVTQIEDLCQLLQLDPSQLKEPLEHFKNFPLRVPRGFVERMRPSDPNDPLLRQVLPLAQEGLAVKGYSLDPLQEKESNPLPAVLHKYKNRILLTLTGGCAIHCRYCFRRHFPYSTNQLGPRALDEIVAYLQGKPAVNEIILSGGDPLLLTDKALSQLSETLKPLPQIKRLRIHSRLPIVLPERLHGGFLTWLATLPWPVVLVLHCNHPQEINDEVSAALRPLKERGVLLLNHTVLLKGINDSVKTLADLSEKLFSMGVQPYYLHLLDKVAGAAHFDLSLAVAKKIYRDLSQELPGFLLPKLVREKPGCGAKLIISNEE